MIYKRDLSYDQNYRLGQGWFIQPYQDLNKVLSQQIRMR